MVNSDFNGFGFPFSADDRRISPPRRSHIRYTLSMPVMLRSGDKVYAADLVNISIGGAMIQCSAPVEFGAAVSLKMEEAARPINAVVVWTDTDRFGVTFVREDGSSARMQAWIDAKSAFMMPTRDRRLT